MTSRVDEPSNLAVSPMLVQPATRTSLIEGNELRLACTVVMGNPPPHVHWRRNGEPIAHSPDTRVGANFDCAAS